MSVKTRRKPLLTKIIRLLVAVLILFAGYSMGSSELGLRKYEKAFAQVEHPENTMRLDAFDLEVDYYPATYMDDSILFQSAFLVGEIRSYNGNWDVLRAFYSDQGLEISNTNLLPVWTIPLQIEHNAQRSWLGFPQEFSYDPFQADILQVLQDHYSSTNLAQRFGKAQGSIYLVYMFADP